MPPGSAHHPCCPSRLCAGCRGDQEEADKWAVRATTLGEALGAAGHGEGFLEEVAPEF